MPMKILEGLPLRFFVQEIAPMVTNSRIQRVLHHPTRHETWLELYTSSGKRFLLMSCYPELSLFYVSPEKASLPPQVPPTQWIQLLNKYLVGGKIVALEQVGWDRVVCFTIRNASLWQEIQEFYLFLELTRRNANCILTRKDEQRTVVGVYRRVPPDKNRFRTLLVGHPYLFPPQKRKENPLDLLSGRKTLAIETENENIAQWIKDHVDGIGNFLGSILAAGFSPETQDWPTIFQKLFTPLITGNTKFFVFSASLEETPQGVFWENAYYHPEGYRQYFSSFNEAVVAFHQRWWEKREEETREKERQKWIHRELEFVDTQMQEIQALLSQEEDGENFRMKGELLKLLPGLLIHEQTPEGISVGHPLSNTPVFISLNPSWSIAQNMQHYFHLYRKALIRKEKLKEKLQALEKKKTQLLTYLGDIPSSEISPCPSSTSAFYRFKTDRGNEIWVGRNKKSNQLLIKNASKEDYWLHVRDLPGAHVLLKFSHPENREEEIRKAAQIAGYFSAGKNDNKVEIIVTQVKYLRKIKKSIGKVIFREEQTLRVQPVWPDGVISQDDLPQKNYQ